MDLPDNKFTSPMGDLTAARFGGHTVANENVVSVGTTRQTLLRNNPNRVSWAMINEGLNDVRVTFDPSISSTSGWLLSASGGIILSDWETDGDTVGYEIFGIAVGAPNNVRIREVFRL